MRKISAFLLTAAIVMGLTGCSGASDSKDTSSSANSSAAPTDAKESTADTQPDTSKDDVMNDITPQEIEAAIAAAIGKDQYLCDTDISADALAARYGLDMTKVQSYVAKENSISSVNLDNIIILKVEDGYAEDAVKAINEAFAQTISYVRQYPFGVAKAEGARLYQKDNIVAFILAGAAYAGEDAEGEAKLAAEEYKKIDQACEKLFGSLPENQAVIPEEDDNSGDSVTPDDDDFPLIGG